MTRWLSGSTGFRLAGCQRSFQCNDSAVLVMLKVAHCSLGSGVCVPGMHAMALFESPSVVWQSVLGLLVTSYRCSLRCERLGKVVHAATV